MKIKFNSDNELSLNRTIEIPKMTIVVKMKILYFDRIGISEGIHVNKTSASKEHDVCHYWYFLNYSFKFQINVCNRCLDLLMMSMNLSDIDILNIKSSDYRCIISLISKNEAINLMHNAESVNLNEKSGKLEIKKYKIFLKYI